jgi:hypothetical protein
MSNTVFKLSALASSIAISATLASTALAGGGHALASHTAEAHAARHHHRHHARGIPQHNGGDRDADNRGGPNDGDGNL